MASAMVARARPALAINGTFFSEDGAKRVMGDMVKAGVELAFDGLTVPLTGL